jgi:hypothetical protein
MIPPAGKPEPSSRSPRPADHRDKAEGARRSQLGQAQSMHEELRELVRGVGLAVGLVIVMGIVVLIASFVVSAVF